MLKCGHADGVDLAWARARHTNPPGWPFRWCAGGLQQRLWNRASTDAPGAEDHAPMLRGIEITPKIGVKSVTTFTLHADATDSDSDTLAYAWTGIRTIDNTEQSIGSTPYISFVAGNVASPIHVRVTDGRGGSTASDSV